MVNETKRVADVYVTKWWQASGITLVRNAEVHEYQNTAHGAVHRMARWGTYATYVYGQDFHYSYEDACARIAKQAESRGASLKKQLAKITAAGSAAKAHETPVHEYKETR